MKKYMFGLDASDPRGALRKLTEHGYDGVVAGSTDEIRAVKEAGLEAWLCYGAHSAGEADRERYGAIDADGMPAPWFGSACPSAEEVSRPNMERAIRSAVEAGADGLFCDGARFASFASTEGVDSFFGCFCPRCTRRMERMGYDAEEIRTGISALKQYLNGDTSHNEEMISRAVGQWLDFRTDAVREYMEAFATATHGAGLRAGAFVFAPSLCGFVGQRMESVTMLDTVAPMLYRAYPHAEGPACLGHEWHAFRELLSRAGGNARMRAQKLFGVELSYVEDAETGFSPMRVAEEVRQAKAGLRAGQKLLPILQTEDEQLDETVRGALAAGADGYGEFMYGQKAW